MKFYHQTRFGHCLKENVKERGNCLPTCLGCFMHIEPEEMFQMQEHYKKNSVEKAHTLMEKWLKERRYVWVSIKGHMYNDAYYMMTVKTDKGATHVVICKNGFVVHDPMPARVKIVEELSYEILIPAKDYNEKKGSFVIRPQKLVS